MPTGRGPETREAPEEERGDTTEEAWRRRWGTGLRALPEPAADYDENAPPESWHGAGAVISREASPSLAKPRTDWSNPTLPTLDDIKAAGATRLEARNSPGFRALANRLQLSGEYDANGGMYARVTAWVKSRDDLTRPALSHGPDETGTPAGIDGARRCARECGDDG